MTLALAYRMQAMGEAGEWLHSLSQETRGKTGVEIEEAALRDDVAGDREGRGAGGGGETFTGQLQTDLAIVDMSVLIRATQITERIVE